MDIDFYLKLFIFNQLILKIFFSYRVSFGVAEIEVATSNVGINEIKCLNIKQVTYNS